MMQAAESKEFESLRLRSQMIVSKLFLRTPPVQPTQLAQWSSNLREKYECALILYRTERYGDALDAFRLIQQDSAQIGFDRTARLSAAACAAAAAKFSEVVELLH